MTRTVTLAGNPVEVAGKFPQKGQHAPAFSLVGKDLADVTLAGIAARAVVVLDENDRVLHGELVPEIKNEPDYAAALAALA